MNDFIVNPIFRTYCNASATLFSFYTGRERVCYFVTSRRRDLINLYLLFDTSLLVIIILRRLVFLTFDSDKFAYKVLKERKTSTFIVVRCAILDSRQYLRLDRLSSRSVSSQKKLPHVHRFIVFQTTVFHLFSLKFSRLSRRSVIRLGNSNYYRLLNYLNLSRRLYSRSGQVLFARTYLVSLPCGIRDAPCKRDTL